MMPSFFASVIQQTCHLCGVAVPLHLAGCCKGCESKISPRAVYVHRSYSLTQTPAGWRAEVAGCLWSKNRVIEGADKAAVIGKFRALWGHFNFDDEARAFGQIFPAHAA